MPTIAERRVALEERLATAKTQTQLAQADLKSLQKECPHPNGKWQPSGRYKVSFLCPDCEKTDSKGG